MINSMEMYSEKFVEISFTMHYIVSLRRKCLSYFVFHFSANSEDYVLWNCHVKTNQPNTISTVKFANVKKFKYWHKIVFPPPLFWILSTLHLWSYSECNSCLHGFLKVIIQTKCRYLASCSSYPQYMDHQFVTIQFAVLPSPSYEQTPSLYSNDFYWKWQISYSRLH